MSTRFKTVRLATWAGTCPLNLKQIVVKLRRAQPQGNWHERFSEFRDYAAGFYDVSSWVTIEHEGREFVVTVDLIEPDTDRTHALAQLGELLRKEIDFVPE